MNICVQRRMDGRIVLPIKFNTNHMHLFLNYSHRSIDGYSFSSQVFSLGMGNNDYVAAGYATVRSISILMQLLCFKDLFVVRYVYSLENSELKVFNIAQKTIPPHTDTKHRGPVLSLKYSHTVRGCV